LALADYDKKRAANKAGGTTRRGIGIATFHHGAGFTGSGEVMLSSRVDVAGLPDGRIEVLSANIEMGQGTITVFTALAAARLGLTPDDVVVAEADTARVTDLVAVQEIGKVLHETFARGQVQGGVAQGIGWALLEDCKWQDGAMANAQLTNYLIPTTEDLPPIRVAFLENPYPHGAQ